MREASQPKPSRGVFPESVKAHRLARVRALMAGDRYDLDALIVTSPENIKT
ncbi:MAG TPA: hypothetical protein VF148_14560 [Acidimicrobiia bacterium]